MNKNDIDKAFVSPYDEFLFEFDATHAKSASQINEINKYKRIFAMRDMAISNVTTDDIWDEF
ncbi:MAG: CBU_0585 family protein [Legionellaceae bacterium]|nr:CBU_0585 family protein [Legionellaceae bacterium]